MRFYSKERFCNPVVFEIIIAQKYVRPPGNMADVIIETVCAQLSVTQKAFLGPTRLREVVEARQIATYIIKRKMPTLTWKQIGKMIGGRDHATAMYSVNTVNDLRDTSKVFEATYTRVYAAVNYRLRCE